MDGYKNWATREVILTLLNTEHHYLATKHLTRFSEFVEYCEEMGFQEMFTKEQWEEIDWNEVYEIMTVEDEE